MKVLIACEFSGIVRDAFIKQGHDAVSCDLLPTERPGPHIQGDVLQHLRYCPVYRDYDLMIAFPPCTYLCNSGVRWLYNKDKTRNKKRYWLMHGACMFFNSLLKASIKKIAIENPIQHCHVRKKIRKYDQIIQPWQFGHGETKATCLWLKGLPELKSTNIVDGREHKVHKLSALKGIDSSKDRKKNRSITYQGIADAMAEQWGQAGRR